MTDNPYHRRRIALDLTNEEVAQRADVTRQYCWKLDNGYRPGKRLYRRAIAEALACSPDDLWPRDVEARS